jgi:large subunit ribosomal protein L19
MDVSRLIENKKNAKIPDIAPGDTVRVSTKIVEGDKERIQVLQGVVIKIKRGGTGASYTVRYVAFGIGVERTFLMTSPMVDKVEIVRQGKVRRAKLYYLRGLSGKEARRKIKRVERAAKQVGEELVAEQPEEIVEPIMDEAAVAAAKEAEAKAAAEKPAEAKAEKPAAETKAEKPAAKAEKPAAKAEAPKAEEPKAAKEEKKPSAEKPAEPSAEKKEEPKAADQK